MSSKNCNRCANSGWETMDKVAACNCCDGAEFFIPIGRNCISRKHNKKRMETKAHEYRYREYDEEQT